MTRIINTPNIICKKYILASMKTIICIIVFSIFISSCNNEKDLVLGTWAIESITDTGEDAMFEYYSNLISFTKDRCVLPKPRYNGQDTGKWNFIIKQNHSYLIINVGKNKISGEYRIVFEKDLKRKLLLMHLTSEKMKITCVKAVNHFNNQLN